MTFLNPSSGAEGPPSVPPASTGIATATIVPAKRWTVAPSLFRLTGLPLGGCAPHMMLPVPGPKAFVPPPLAGEDLLQEVRRDVVLDDQRGRSPSGAGEEPVQVERGVPDGDTQVRRGHRVGEEGRGDGVRLQGVVEGQAEGAPPPDVDAPFDAVAGLPLGAQVGFV